MTGGERTPPARRHPGGDGVVGLVFQREEFLERLSNGTADKPELIDEIGASRSTVDRALKQLQLEGLVEKRSGRYGLTLYGRLTLRAYRRVLRETETMRRSKDALRLLPPSAELDPAFFRRGMVLSDGNGETSPAAFIRELLEGAETFRTVTKSPHFELISLAHRRVVEEDMRFELVHSADSVERLNLHYPDVVESALASGNLEMYSLDDVPPFGLLKAARPTGETVVLVLYGPGGAADTVIVNETGLASLRFDEVFRECKAEATKVGLEG